MKTPFYLVVIVLSYIFMLQPVHASQTGDLQVYSTDGLRVYIDGGGIGTTNTDDEGLYVSDLAQGDHLLKVSKKGYQPKTYNISIRPNRTTGIHIEYLVPNVKISQSGNNQTSEIKSYYGGVRIRTKPMKATIEFSGQTVHKDTDLIRIDELPVGEYVFEFTRKNKTLTHKISVRRGEIVVINADFKKDMVTDHYGSLLGIRFTGFRDKDGNRIDNNKAKVVKVRKITSFGNDIIKINDEIIEVNGQTFSSYQELTDLLYLIRPPEEATFTIIRDGFRKSIAVNMLERSFENMEERFINQPNDFERIRLERESVANHNLNRLLLDDPGLNEQHKLLESFKVGMQVPPGLDTEMSKEIPLWTTSETSW